MSADLAWPEQRGGAPDHVAHGRPCAERLHAPARLDDVVPVDRHRGRRHRRPRSEPAAVSHGRRHRPRQHVHESVSVLGEGELRTRAAWARPRPPRLPPSTATRSCDSPSARLTAQAGSPSRSTSSAGVPVLRLRRLQRPLPRALSTSKKYPTTTQISFDRAGLPHRRPTTRSSPTASMTTTATAWGSRGGSYTHACSGALSLLTGTSHEIPYCCTGLTNGNGQLPGKRCDGLAQDDRRPSLRARRSHAELHRLRRAGRHPPTRRSTSTASRWTSTPISNPVTAPLERS